MKVCLKMVTLNIFQKRSLSEVKGFFFKLFLGLTFFLSSIFFAQEINTNTLSFLPTFIDSSTNQILIFTDSLPDNIFFPHTIYWDGNRWVTKIELENNFPNSNIKVALTEKGFLFFIFPQIDSAKYLMFIDGKWIEKQNPQSD